jgi:very-short-patch-repair endonuclease
VDFYCDELRLVIEIDGDVHETPAQKNRDAARDKRLFELGYQVLRIPNGLAIRDPESFLQMLQTLRPSPGAPLARHPLPGGEGL